jgi:hypothetical protein
VVINNPTELREKARQIFAQSTFTINGTPMPKELMEEAVEEVIGGIVKVYMGEGQLTACEQIVGTILTDALITMNQKVTTSQAPNPEA